MLAFVFCAFHETAHRTAFRTRWMNTALGTLAGLLTFWPYRNYRVYHWEHHRFTQDEARDPELFFAKPASSARYLLALTGVPNAIRRVGRSSAARGRSGRPAVDGRAGASARSSWRRASTSWSMRWWRLASALTGTPIVLLVWIAPLLVGQAFLRPYLLAEHTACGVTRDCLENTRTTLTLALVRLFAWNMPYHAEHHAYPAVPFHALPRLHGHVRARLGNLEPGYVAATVKVNRYLFARGRPRRVAGRAPR